MITISRVLEDRFAHTRQLFGEALDDNGDEEGATLQSKAQDLLMLHKISPLPHFSAARGMIDLGVVRNAYEFSIGTEDDCLMMVMDRERGSKDFLEQALQYAAHGKGTDAQAIEQASELLSILTEKITDNLTCAEKVVQIHVDTKAVMPEKIRVCWWKIRRAYACFCKCVEMQLASALPVLRMIANGGTSAANWQEASVAWRKQYATRTLPVR